MDNNPQLKIGVGVGPLNFNRNLGSSEWVVLSIIMYSLYRLIFTTIIKTCTNLWARPNLQHTQWGKVSRSLIIVILFDLL